MLCIIVPNPRTVSPEFSSWVRTRRLSSLAHAPKKYTQSANFQFDIKSPSDFKILSARNSHFFSLYRDYSNSLTLPNASVDSSGAEFLLTISKFMKRMNFVIACLRPSQNVKLGIFTGSRAVDSKEMYKKAWCTCKVVVLPCEAIANLTFSSLLHLKVPIIYDTLWSVKNRIFSGQIKLLLLIASQTFLRFWLWK